MVKHVCNVEGCPMTYPKMEYYKNHQKWHTDQTNFPCLTCRLGFISARGRNRHYLSGIHSRLQSYLRSKGLEVPLDTFENTLPSKLPKQGTKSLAETPQAQAQFSQSLSSTATIESAAAAQSAQSASPAPPLPSASSASSLPSGSQPPPQSRAPLIPPAALTPSAPSAPLASTASAPSAPLPPSILAAHSKHPIPNIGRSEPPNVPVLPPILPPILHSAYPGISQTRTSSTQAPFTLPAIVERDQEKKSPLDKADKPST